MTAHASYIGRFAPSPTGPLHLGSLIAAVASFLDAKSRQGHWRVRIEDLDPPREVAGATRQILHSLQVHGLHWDGELCWQSQRHEAYLRALGVLRRTGRCFLCDCSRAKLARTDGVYPGYCRNRQGHPSTAAAVRVRVTGEAIRFHDFIQDCQRQQLDSAVGDFVVRRKDGLFAYQLAVVVDDAAQGVTHVVRGADLLDSTARQIYLQRLLKLPEPEYGHFPVLANRQGQKLSKQNFAAAIDDDRPIENLRRALHFLRQPEPLVAIIQPEDLLRWATAHWNRSAIPPIRKRVDQNL